MNINNSWSDCWWQLVFIDVINKKENLSNEKYDLFAKNKLTCIIIVVASCITYHFIINWNWTREPEIANLPWIFFCIFKTVVQRRISWSCLPTCVTRPTLREVIVRTWEKSPSIYIHSAANRNAFVYLELLIKQVIDFNIMVMIMRAIALLVQVYELIRVCCCSVHRYFTYVIWLCRLNVNDILL